MEYYNCAINGEEYHACTQFEYLLCLYTHVGYYSQSDSPIFVKGRVNCSIYALKASVHDANLRATVAATIGADQLDVVLG